MAVRFEEYQMLSMRNPEQEGVPWEGQAFDVMSRE